jgi:hypothetical protein
VRVIVHRLARAHATTCGARRRALSRPACFALTPFRARRRALVAASSRSSARVRIVLTTASHAARANARARDARDALALKVALKVNDASE